MDVLRAEVHSLTKRLMLSIPPVVLLFIQSVHSLKTRWFYLFVEDDYKVPIVGTIREQERDL